MAVKVRITVLTGPQGGGKSRKMREEALAIPGLYLFALPTIDLIEEQRAEFEAHAKGVAVSAIYGDRKLGATVRRLTDERRRIQEAGLKHAVIFTTHATLLDHELTGWDEWHVRIDEAPNTLQGGRVNIGGTLRPFFEKSFELLTASGHEWSPIKERGAHRGWSQIEADTGAVQIKPLLKEARHEGRVWVKTTDWRAKDEIEWFSLWSPTELGVFKSAVIAGTGYTNSIGFRVAQDTFRGLGFTFVEVREVRSAQPSITIRYFVNEDGGTTTYWASEAGLRTLVPMTDYLAGNLTPEEAFWSGNDIVKTVMFGRVLAPFISPVAAGVNKHRERTQCAFIYSARATPEDRPLMEALGLSGENIRDSREGEAIRQFVMRGAIRNPEYGGPYTIYLYSLPQAERLMEHLLGIGFDDVEPQPVEDAGVLDVRHKEGVKGKVKPPSSKRTPEERRAADAERQRKKREAKAEAEWRTVRGYRSRGRGEGN